MLPLWITLAAAGFFALVLLVTVFRAGKSVANVALAVITLLAIASAVASTMRSFNFGGPRQTSLADRMVPPSISLAAIPCLDGLAGDAVEAACERPLFASAEASAAAVSYTAAQITRLAGIGPQAAADNKKMTPELSALRRAVERDRYGLVAHVLSVRDGCTPTDCAFFASLTDHNQIAANMTERVYEGLIGRYALSWNNPAAPAPVAASAPAPAGKPVSGDFPSATSIPPVNIMVTEPGGAAVAAPPGSKPVAATVLHPPAAPAKKPAPKKPPAAPTPTPLAPAQQSDDN